MKKVISTDYGEWRGCRYGVRVSEIPHHTLAPVPVVEYWVVGTDGIEGKPEEILGDEATRENGERHAKAVIDKLVGQA